MLHKMPDCSIRVTDCSIRIYQQGIIAWHKNTAHCASIILNPIYHAQNYASKIAISLLCLNTITLKCIVGVIAGLSW